MPPPAKTNRAEAPNRYPCPCVIRKPIRSYPPLSVAASVLKESLSDEDEGNRGDVPEESHAADHDGNGAVAVPSALATRPMALVRGSSKATISRRARIFFFIIFSFPVKMGYPMPS